LQSKLIGACAKQPESTVLGNSVVYVNLMHETATNNYYSGTSHSYFGQHGVYFTHVAMDLAIMA